jgi:MerR family transcriptional regulator, copper efflux regulator
VLISMSLKIGKVAEQGGVNLQTIRYYEREGLLPRPPRLASGYRMFPEDTVPCIRFIKRAQELRFTLAEIRELLTLRVEKGRGSSEVRSLAESRIADIEGKTRRLTAMKSALSELARRCFDHSPASECTILRSIEAEDGFHMSLKRVKVSAPEGDELI